MSTSSRKTAALPETASIKLTFACTASLKAELDRYPPSPAIAGAEVGRALVDVHDHAGDVVAPIPVVERNGVSTLDSRVRAR